LKLKITDYLITKITFDSESYPLQLKQLQDPPKQLYYRGTWGTHLFDKTLAIVGSRRVTSYGERVLDMLIPNLVAEGVTIISGFMYGVDTLAHQKTLECGGKTIAVLGGGLNVLYPPENERMYMNIINVSKVSEVSKVSKEKKESKGLVISEYAPDQQPQLWTFPQRNRIVAALSTLGVLVIEASEKSGSLVTAKIAKKLNRPLFAIPGPITSSVSRGTNQLIKDGLAKMVVSSTDIVGAGSPSPIIIHEIQTGAKTAPLQNIEKQIIEILSLEPLTLDELALKLNKTIIELGQVLTIMSLQGKISEENGKYYLK
jgi:DNA processing protein